MDNIHYFGIDRFSEPKIKMIFNSDFKKKKIVIVGLGISGMSLAKKLFKDNVDIKVWDDNPRIRKIAIKNGLALKKIEKIKFSQIDYLILSPGIQHIGPNAHISAKNAEKNNCKIISDLELLYYLKRKSLIIGVTGTNGKSTTVSLIEHILLTNGVKAEACGNIGKPFSSINNLHKKILIVEASSYQLERLQNLKFNIAVLLNIQKDHMERHLKMSNYISAKRKIFKNNTLSDYAIISNDDLYCQKISKELIEKRRTNVISFSTRNSNKFNVRVEDHENFLLIIDDSCKTRIKVLKKRLNISLGKKNYQNIISAYCVSKILKIKTSSFRNSLYCFKGLPHRIEKFCSFNNVEFYNDSKATNISSTIFALNSLTNIYLLIGGENKKSNFEDLNKNFKNVLKTFTFGKANKLLKMKIKQKNILTFKNLEESTEFAFKEALLEKKKISFLLSPACASFDEFENFEKRGNFFKNKILKLVLKEQK